MKCPKCDNEVSGNFCSVCGTSLPQQVVAPTEPQPVPLKSRTKPMSVGMMILVGLVILVIIGIMVSLNNEPARQPNSTFAPPPPPSLPPVPAVEKTGNRAHDLLMARSEREQMIALGKIIDEPCTVNKIMYQGMSKELMALWSVGCTNGHSYQIGIEADENGSTRCVDCAVLKLVGVNCWEKFKNP